MGLGVGGGGGITGVGRGGKGVGGMPTGGGKGLGGLATGVTGKSEGCVVSPIGPKGVVDSDNKAVHPIRGSPVVPGGHKHTGRCS